MAVWQGHGYEDAGAAFGRVFVPRRPVQAEVAEASYQVETDVRSLIRVEAGREARSIVAHFQNGLISVNGQGQCTTFRPCMKALATSSLAMIASDVP